MKLTIPILAALTLTLTAGEKLSSLKLEDGTELIGVEIKEVTRKGIRLIHKNGGGLVPFDKLPQKLKDQCLQAPDVPEAERPLPTPATVSPDASPAAEARPAGPVCKIGPIEMKVIHITPGIIDLGSSRTGGYHYVVEVKNTSGRALGFDLELAEVRSDGSVSPADPALYDMKVPAGGTKNIRVDLLLAPGKDFGVSSITAYVTSDSLKTAAGNIFVPHNAKETGLFYIPAAP